MKKIFFYSISLLSILSCNVKSETDREIQERIKNESLKAQESISNNNQQIEKWYKAKQTDSLINYMADDVIQFPPNSKPLIGKDIKNYWSQLFHFGGIDFSLQTQEVKANGPLAIERGKYSLKFILTETLQSRLMGIAAIILYIGAKSMGIGKLCGMLP